MLQDIVCDPNNLSRKESKNECIVHVEIDISMCMINYHIKMILDNIISPLFSGITLVEYN